MCYAIPGRVVCLNGEIAVVDYFGEQRTVLNNFSKASIGDFVYAQGGIIIGKIPQLEALQILEEWKQRFFKLKEIDSKISQAKKPREFSKSIFEKTLQKAMSGKTLQKPDVIRLLEEQNPAKLKLLYNAANSIRQERLKNSCCVHGIIEFSNYCRNDCFYCGIRKSNKVLERYRMSVEEIVKIAELASSQLGFKALVLQSGEDSYYTIEKIEGIIRKILEKNSVLLFVSVGNRSFQYFERMYNVGARGMLLKFETSNPKLYSQIHLGPKADFKKRIKLIKHAKKLGFIVITGSIVGIPNQTVEDLAEDIMLMRKIRADMLSFGPLIPHKHTPFASVQKPSIDTALKIISACRLAIPDSKIISTTALETLNPEGKKACLLSGANSLMINLTPLREKKLYDIYPSRAGNGLSVEENIRSTLKLLYSLGRAPTDLGV